MFVYADNAATTKMSKTAIDAMLPYMETIYGNPIECFANISPAVGETAMRQL